MNARELPTSALSFERVSLASTIDLLEILLRRKLVFVATVAAAVISGLLYYLQATPVYESRAGLLLVQRRPELVTRDQRFESAFEDYVATHRALIVSPMIAGRAIESAKLGSLRTFNGIEPADLRKTIIEQLIVTSGPRDLGEKADSIMSLAFQGPIAEECPVIVQAILESYRAFLDETYRGMSNDTLRLITEARDLLKNDLQRNEDAYVEFRQQSPLVARGTDEVNPLQDRLAAIETRRTDLLLRRAEIEGQLKSLEAAKKQDFDHGQMTAFLASLRGDLSSDDPTTNSSLDSQLFQLSDRERQLLEHFGPGHPHVVALRERIAAARQLQALPSVAHSSALEATDEANQPSPEAIVNQYVAYLEQERDWIDSSEQLLSSLYQKEHNLAQELSSYQLKDERFRRAIDLTQELYEGVIGQLQEASLVKDFGGFDALVIADPELGEKVSPRGKIVLALAGLVGAFLGLALAVVAELRDKSFRSRSEIQSRLGLRVLAEMPGPEHAASVQQLGVGDRTISPLLYAHGQPESIQSEAIRGLRTTLLFNPNTASVRVIQLTAPSADDGINTIAANLAISIAQLGHRVLLIDADTHQPIMHEWFGVPNSRGLTSMFSIDNPAEDAVCETGILGLALLPAGPRSENVSELFTSRRFAELLRSLRNQYDYILLNTAPLLIRSDPCVIASQVDGVLLGIRPTKDSRWRAERAAEILATTGIQPIGAIVNGIGSASAWGYQTMGSQTANSARQGTASHAVMTT